jgi:hypothetical protein
MTRKEILTEAERCVCTDREQQYGTPKNNFRLIAHLWEPYLKAKCVSPGSDVCINPEDVAVMMALLKIARIATGKFKDDSYIDACGYIACAGEIAGNGNG